MYLSIELIYLKFYLCGLRGPSVAPRFRVFLLTTSIFLYTYISSTCTTISANTFTNTFTDAFTITFEHIYTHRGERRRSEHHRAAALRGPNANLCATNMYDICVYIYIYIFIYICIYIYIYIYIYISLYTYIDTSKNIRYIYTFIQLYHFRKCF